MVTTILAIAFFIFVGLLLVFMILGAKKKLGGGGSKKIEINEDQELTKEVEQGVTLLTALSSFGIAVPSPCGGKATCKQCRVQVVEGGGEAAETDKATFSIKEIKAAWRLSCQCKVRGNLKVTLPTAYLEIKKFKGKVVSNENVATFIKELVIDLPEDVNLSYVPGDYLQFYVPPFVTNTSDWKSTIDPKFHDDWDKFKMFGTKVDFSKLDEDVVRAYSFASFPGEGNRVKFNIRIATPPFKKGRLSRRIPWGICSSYLFALKPGDEVELSGPFGESHMIDDNRELVFLIGGAGSSFGRSHILDLFKSQNTTRKVSLWYGARALRENIYQTDFENLQREKENFSYNLVLSEPLEEDFSSGWPKDDPTKTGFLFRAFELGQLKQMEEPENCLYYVCGPPMHNKSVLKLLDDYGVSCENIVLDDFGN